jgi:hypothetical protein
MLVRLAVLAFVALSFAASASAAGRVPPPMPANICVTPRGWCDLPGITAPLGYACVCLDADHVQVQGVTQRLAHTGPLSPYLRPTPTRAAPTQR